MNRRQRRLKAKEIIKVHKVKNAQLNKHSAFLAALNNLPDEELELLKTNPFPYKHLTSPTNKKE